MSARRASSAAPTNALKVWTDGRTLYVEIDGAILSYALNTAGLSKALALIHKTQYDWGGAAQAFPTPLTLTDATAQTILRRRGITR